jgi:hypothetical protein
MGKLEKMETPGSVPCRYWEDPSKSFCADVRSAGVAHAFHSPCYCMIGMDLAPWGKLALSLF